jgi:predicted Fe-S protein YdhL (DUF1289 family)
MDPAAGFCLGCWRTLTEIAGWRDFSVPEKQIILGRLGARKGTHGSDPSALVGQTR